MPSASDVARIQSAAQSDVGRTRTENQDAFGEFSSSSGERLFVVADGMGGHRGGATASRLCVETLGRAFTDGDELAEERLRHGFELANARIHAAAQTDQELAGMGTTAVALVLAPDGSGALGWVGDSRAYRFSGGALERLSTDHSVVGEMIRAGVITEQEADNHPRRNELLRAIGPHEVVEPETVALQHAPGDRFLLCSDGLWGPVAEAEIAIVLGYETPELAVKKLIAMANECGGPDNVTAQIASVADPALDLPLPVPPAAHRAEATTRSRTLPLLASGAVVATAALIALAVYSVRQNGEPRTSAPPGEVTAQVAPAVAAAEAREVEPAPPVATKPPAPIRAAPPPATPAPKPKAAAPKPAAPKPEAAAKPKPIAPEVEKPAAAKSAEAKPAEAKPAEAKPAAPKPEAPKTDKPAVAEPAPPVVAATSPVTAVPEPPQAKAPEIAPPPAEVAPAPEPATPVPAQASASPASSLLAVEQFLLDWETAVASKDFALYTRLGLPGNEESFRTHYVENEARIDFSLRDFGPAAADELVVRVQMVLETQDPTGTQRVDEERSFVVRQTPDGLRYVGSQKD